MHQAITTTCGFTSPSISVVVWTGIVVVLVAIVASLITFYATIATDDVLTDTFSTGFSLGADDS